MIIPGDYKTVCGMAAKVFISTGKNWTVSSNHGQAIGAVLIPNEPAAFPGWEACEWDAETGKCISRQFIGWDLNLN